MKSHPGPYIIHHTLLDYVVFCHSVAYQELNSDTPPVARRSSSALRFSRARLVMPTDDGGSLGEENSAEEKSKRPDGKIGEDDTQEREREREREREKGTQKRVG